LIGSTWSSGQFYSCHLLFSYTIGKSALISLPSRHSPDRYVHPVIQILRRPFYNQNAINTLASGWSNVSYNFSSIRRLGRCSLKPSMEIHCLNPKPHLRFAIFPISTRSFQFSGDAYIDLPIWGYGLPPSQSAQLPRSKITSRSRKVS
jgi:hypothetical protein